MFILAIILAVIALVVIVIGLFVEARAITITVGAVILIVAVILTIVSATFSQDVRQASVIKDWTGNVVGTVSDSGFHGKKPWESVITFDTTNQRVVFVDPKTSTGDNTGGASDGREIAVTDKDGVASNVDVTVRYNLNPAKVSDIYKNYKNEDNLKTTLIYNDIRTVVRTEAGKFHTLALLTDRQTYANAIQKELAKRWKSQGVLVDEVALQQIDPPQSVKDSYADAQKSQIEVQKATNDLNATKVSAQQQVVQAQAQADANNILSASLSPQVLQQKYLDALKSGTIYVVPEGSTPFIGSK